MKPRLKPLDQQAIVITGASSGIGLATARMAAAQGAKVLLVARNEAALAEIAGEITANGGTADFKVADVGDARAVQAAAAHAVQRFGRIDTWMNVAGIAIYARLVDTPADEHEQLFRTNYFGVVHGCLAAIPHLRETGGALITVGSVASDMPSPVMGAYAAVKHATKAYVEVLRIELAEAGAPIAVTLVKPAGIDTPIAQHAANHEGGAAQIPPPSYDPEIVARALLHCAVHPTRTITVGGAGRAQALFAQHFPALFERLAPLAAKAFVDRSKAQPTPSNLFEAVRPGRVHSGEQHPRRFSVYTTVAEHAGMAMALTAGVAAGGLLLLMRGRPGAR